MADTAKTPQRSPDQIAADIAGERAQLGTAFDTLRVGPDTYDDFENPASNYSHLNVLWSCIFFGLEKPGLAFIVSAAAGR